MSFEGLTAQAPGVYHKGCFYLLHVGKCIIAGIGYHCGIGIQTVVWKYKHFSSVGGESWPS